MDAVQVILILGGITGAAVLIKAMRDAWRNR
jgi:hypothetical protein